MKARARSVDSLPTPLIVQDTGAPYDLPGELFWKSGTVNVKSSSPTVYWYLTHAFRKKEPVVQLNYVFWYSARGGPLSPWIERGDIDGLTVRVSLDRNGNPFMVDVMNNCGCYHFFAPARSSVEGAVPKAWALDPFVPEWLPEIPPGESLAVRLNSGWHQVQYLSSSTPAANAQEYALVPYEILETLPDESGRGKSVFDGEAILRGSERIEPYILFSMGVPEVGAMRQRGHHPIALVGRAYFDDPELFNSSFTFR